ncbi:MAG: ferritin family protein, partial [Chloroflexota bacterium]
FYTNIADKVKSKSLVEELQKIAAMETGHRDRLKKLDPANIIINAPKKVADLKIADYLVAQEPTKGMTWQDILTIAMHRELASQRLYTDLAARVDDATIRQLFENLAAEEAGHKRYFEQIWDEEILIWN